MIVFKPRPIKNIPDVNCADLEVIMGRIKMGPSASKLSDLQSELNRLFKMSYCESVIYTKNTDKPFFGMCVMPTLTQIDFLSVLIGLRKLLDNTVSFSFTCPKCNHEFNHTIDLEEKFLDFIYDFQIYNYV